MTPSLLRFIFTYNSTTCGRNSNFTGEKEIVAVLVPTGGNFNVAVASGGFFFLSALFHGFWVFGMTVWEPLGRLLLGWLAAAFAPLRWLEYAASAALMMAVLTVISGGRNQTDLASIWMLMSTTMAMGFLTELGSRPDESSNGERWQGELPDRSNRCSCYVRRMAPHVVGFFPYFSAWAILYSIYITTLNDIEEAFPSIDEAIPRYIIAALTSTFAIFSTCAPPPRNGTQAMATGHSPRLLRVCSYVYANRVAMASPQRLLDDRTGVRATFDDKQGLFCLRGSVSQP